jgi:hypothetical protein
LQELAGENLRFYLAVDRYDAMCKTLRGQYNRLKKATEAYIQDILTQNHENDHTPVSIGSTTAQNNSVHYFGVTGYQAGAGARNTDYPLGAESDSIAPSSVVGDSSRSVLNFMAAAGANRTSLAESGKPESAGSLVSRDNSFLSLESDNSLLNSAEAVFKVQSADSASNNIISPWPVAAVKTRKPYLETINSVSNFPVEDLDDSRKSSNSHHSHGSFNNVTEKPTRASVSSFLFSSKIVPLAEGDENLEPDGNVQAQADRDLQSLLDTVYNLGTEREYAFTAENLQKATRTATHAVDNDETPK